MSLHPPQFFLTGLHQLHRAKNQKQSSWGRAPPQVHCRGLLRLRIRITGWKAMGRTKDQRVLFHNPKKLAVANKLQQDLTKFRKTYLRGISPVPKSQTVLKGKPVMNRMPLKLQKAQGHSEKN